MVGPDVWVWRRDWLYIWQSGAMDARVEWLTVAGDPEVWRSIGLTVSADGTVPLFGTSLRIVSQDEIGAASDAGLLGWVFSGIDADVDAIAGLPTDVVQPQGPVFAQHPMGAIELDHVVVMTGDLEATTTAIADATGCELKRVREIGAIRQGFHRIGRGGLIVEVVHHPDYGDGPPTFWGLVLNVEDIDEACDLIGEGRVSAPKDAVQPGRRIATISKDVGLGLPVALMTRSV